MEQSRYPRLCLFRLTQLHLNNNANIELNWVSQLDHFLQLINMSHLWNSLDAQTWIDNRQIALERLHLNLKLKDILSDSNANATNCRILRTIEERTAPYLLHRGQFHMAKVIAQLRLSSKYNTRFCIKGQIHRLDIDKQCTLCNLCTNETIKHFLFECPVYSAVRSHHLGPLLNIFERNEDALLVCTDAQVIKSIYFYIINSLRIRAFLLNE